MTETEPRKTSAVVLFSGGHARPSTRAAIAELLWGLPWLQITATEDWDALRWDRVAPYDLVITYTGDRTEACTAEQLAGLTRFVEGGRGFVPLHFTSKNANPDFLALIGAKFLNHPPYGPFTVKVTDADHPITRGLPTIEIEDECYRSEYPDRDALHLLQSSYHDAGIDGEPSSWVREIGAGRLFYSALGHDARSFSHPVLRELLTRGIRWAARLDPVALSAETAPTASR
jgi:uncharacterized protein